jgi:hypothetical protein
VATRFDPNRTKQRVNFINVLSHAQRVENPEKTIKNDKIPYSICSSVYTGFYFGKFGGRSVVGPVTWQVFWRLGNYEWTQW